MDSSSEAIQLDRVATRGDLADDVIDVKKKYSSKKLIWSLSTLSKPPKKTPKGDKKRDKSSLENTESLSSEDDSLPDVQQPKAPNQISATLKNHPFSNSVPEIASLSSGSDSERLANPERAKRTPPDTQPPKDSPQPRPRSPQATTKRGHLSYNPTDRTSSQAVTLTIDWNGRIQSLPIPLVSLNKLHQTIAGAYAIDVSLLKAMGLEFTVEILTSKKFKQLTESNISHLYKKQQCRVRIAIKDIDEG